MRHRPFYRRVIPHEEIVCGLDYRTPCSPPWNHNCKECAVYRSVKSK